MAIIPIFQALFDGSTNGLFTLFEQWQYQYLNDYKNGRGSNVKLSKVNKTAMEIRGLFSGYLNKYVRKIFPNPQRAIYLSLHKRRLRWNTFRRGTKTVQNNQSVSNDNESPNEENKNEESMEGKKNDSPNAEETNETLNASNNNDNNVNVSQTENSSNSQSMEQSNVTVAPDPSFPGFLQHLRNTPSQNESMNTDQNESNNNSNSSNKNKKNEGTGNMAMNTDSEEHSDKESAKASDKSDDDENELDSDVSDEVITNIPKKQLRGRRSKRLAAKNKPKKKSQTKNRRVKDKSKKKMPKGHRPSKTHASKKSSPLQCLGPEKLMPDHKITRKLKKMLFCKLKNNIKKN
ncbi:MAG: hypothetical protein GY941_09580 [Planctomycetes bacterium]|nr:hypothetical protein [Planctomycetota bacterium]